MGEELFSQELFARNLDVMRSAFIMEYNSMRALGAFLYTAEGRTADKEHIRETKALLKSRKGFFSDFRGHLVLPIVIKMSLSQDPEGYLEGLTDTYKSLSTSFLLGDESRLLAAMVLYENIRSEHRSEMCRETMEIYRAMRKNHPLLTSQADLPFAVLMALKQGNIDEQIRNVEVCYQIVGKKFPLSKDDVQTVSHILAAAPGDAAEKSERFLNMYEAFKKAGIRISGRCMAILAVLTNSSLSVEEAVSQSVENDRRLKKQKGFGLLGTGTEIRRLFAAAVTAVNQIPEAEGTAAFEALSSSILSVILSIELMILIMIISSSSASSSSSSSHS